jgi:putative SOS response-associated peptidase YedK
MCGRYTITLDPAELLAAFELMEMHPEWLPRYNVAPTQPVAVLTDAADRKVDFMYWGLVPSWAKDISIGSKLINARAETVTEKPSFRTAFRRRRCLILADGFYEWTKADKARGIPATPHYFRMKDGSPFAFAGLWEIWESPEGDLLKSCTIITTAANSVVSPVHERMPVIFTPAAGWDWLAERPADQLLAMLKPFPPEAMTGYPVSRLVNDSKREDPAMIQAV